MPSGECHTSLVRSGVKPPSSHISSLNTTSPIESRGPQAAVGVWRDQPDSASSSPGEITLSIAAMDTSRNILQVRNKDRRAGRPCRPNTQTFFIEFCTVVEYTFIEFIRVLMLLLPSNKTATCSETRLFLGRCIPHRYTR